MPDPNNEKYKGKDGKKEFISDCISARMKEGGENQDQAVAVCYSIWDNKDKKKESKASAYGYCPICGAEGVSRERRLDGNDTCSAGHTYPSKSSTIKPQYKSTIYGSIRAADSKELEKYGVSKASLISQANNLIPSSFDTEKNMDVLPIVFNLAVVNKFNANDDGISTKTAASIVKNFINKPINIEHMKDQIVGHIINASFSDKQPDYMENDLMDFIDRKDPFYITAAGVIYRHIYPELADALIRASKEEDDWYGAYSSSWEIGFNEFDIAVGSEMLMECEVIDSEEKEDDYEEMKGNLRCFGGSGSSNKGKVYRLIKGEALPLGAALTTNPAAEVKGIYPLSSTFSSEKDKKETYGNKNISIIDNNDVNDKKSKDSFQMTDEQFKKLTDLLEKGVQSDKGDVDEAVASLKDFAEVIKKEGTEWKSKAEKAQEALAKANEELESVRKEQEKTSEELKSIKADMEAKAAAQLFNDRVASVEERFELSDAQKAIVIEDVKGLGSADEDFDKYMTRAAVIFADCDKETKEEREEAKRLAVEAAAKKLESTASKKEGEEPELETEDESKASVTNTNGDAVESKSLIERLRDSGLETE